METTQTELVDLTAYIAEARENGLAEELEQYGAEQRAELADRTRQRDNIAAERDKLVEQIAEVTTRKSACAKLAAAGDADARRDFDKCQSEMAGLVTRKNGLDELIKAANRDLAGRAELVRELRYAYAIEGPFRVTCDKMKAIHERLDDGLVELGKLFAERAKLDIQWGDERQRLGLPERSRNSDTYRLVGAALHHLNLPTIPPHLARYFRMPLKEVASRYDLPQGPHQVPDGWQPSNEDTDDE